MPQLPSVRAQPCPGAGNYCSSLGCPSCSSLPMGQCKGAEMLMTLHWAQAQPSFPSPGQGKAGPPRRLRHAASQGVHTDRDPVSFWVCGKCQQHTVWGLWLTPRADCSHPAIAAQTPQWNRAKGRQSPR